MISIVVPNYNGANLLSKNIPRLLSLLEKTKLEYELIVVDDASTDESRMILEKFEFNRGDPSTRSGSLRAIFVSKNRGFASTADRGIREAKGEVVFVIKTDSVPEKAEYFSILLKHFEDPKVFAVSAALKTVENDKVEIRGCGVIYYKKGFFLHKRANGSSLIVHGNSSMNDEPNAINSLFSAWADGGASAFKRDIYLKIGGFCPIFNPFYWEDVDLGYRAWKAGYEIHFEPKAILLHDFEEGVIGKAYSLRFKSLISLRNQFNFLWCNGDLMNILKYFGWLPYHYLVNIKNGNWDFIKAHLMSLGQSAGLLKERWRRKKLQQKSDSELMEFFKLKIN